MVSQYLALQWRVDHSKGENYHFMTNTDLYFASYVQLSQWGDPIKMHKIFFGNSYKDYHLQCHMGILNNLFEKHKGNLHTSKNYNSVSVYNWSFKILENYFKSKFIHTLNKTTGQPDFPFENDSTMRTVMIDNYRCMKAVSGKSGRAILQNSYWSFNSTVCLTTSVGYAHLDG